MKSSFTINLDLELTPGCKLSDNLNKADEVRELTRCKLEEVESHMEELGNLRNKLTLLINLCRGSDTGYPIIEDLDVHPEQEKPKGS